MRAPRKFDKDEVVLASGKKIALLVHEGEEVAVRLELPGGWKIVSVYPGGESRKTIVTIEQD